MNVAAKRSDIDLLRRSRVSCASCSNYLDVSQFLMLGDSRTDLSIGPRSHLPQNVNASGTVKEHGRI